MKRLSLLSLFGVLASVLAGCPVFSGDGGSGCYSDTCASTGTYIGGCNRPEDCEQNETCGRDGACHTGDCSPPTGCVAGYTCTVDPKSDTASCTPGGGTGGSGTGGSGTGGAGTTSSTGSTGGAGGKGTTSSTGTGGTGGAPVYCGHPSDCPTGDICATDGTCKPGPCSATNACIFGYTCGSDGTCQGGPNACDTSATCSSGSVCIAGPTTNGGVCTPAANQCFDQSQCDGGDKCVAGQCTQSCAANADCRDGFACNTTLGICSKAVKTCTVTNDCGSASKVCVGGTCVPRSTNGTCGAGDVWDENGCIPNQAASFTCQTDGQLGDGTAGKCALNSICLHHSCWISCDSPNQTACSTQSILDECKPVDSGTATYDVCGTAQNLGSQCGAGAMGLTCTGSGQVCIDGFCK